ncbi:hypothetical protein KFU94_44880 [Chloroflexi bacterium TSY]|nr:hypothetical protein [Chloroflexi bacterium TSY]
MIRDYRYAFHIALDSNGINGLEGMAGVCLFLYNPEDDSYAYKVQYYPGMAGGHAVNVNPAGTYGFLGNVGQHLLLYDAKTLNEVDRISTLRFELNDTSIRGSTHLIWLNDDEFITAIGDYFYKFHIDDLRKGERLGPHKVKLPHAMKRTHSGRYLCYGSMDHPNYGRAGEAREVGIWDMETGETTRLELPTTCWHLVCHPLEDWFYAVSFRVLPQDGEDYYAWAIGFLKEYAFEIDAANKQIQRHWTCSREVPAHINSDVTISDRELIYCNGASHSIICIDLETFANHRMIDEKPDLQTMIEHPREIATQVYDSFTRGNFFTNSRHFFGALRVSRFSLLDSIYACQLSKDQSLLFTANRGLNHITIYDYPSNCLRLRVKMPDLHEYEPSLHPMSDPRLSRSKFQVLRENSG